MKVNGKIYNFENKITIYDLLQYLKLNQEVVVVEFNYNIIPKSEYRNIILNDDDNLEVVSFVGGG